MSETVDQPSGGLAVPRVRQLGAKFPAVIHSLGITHLKWPTAERSQLASTRKYPAAVALRRRSRSYSDEQHARHSVGRILRGHLTGWVVIPRAIQVIRVWPRAPYDQPTRWLPLMPLRDGTIHPEHPSHLALRTGGVHPIADVGGSCANTDRCDLRHGRLDCANARYPFLAVGRVDSSLTDQPQS